MCVYDIEDAKNDKTKYDIYLVAFGEHLEGNTFSAQSTKRERVYLNCCHYRKCI